MPKGYIDITNASSIGMMDQDVHGFGHIFYISTPSTTHYLSASLCDERSQWLLALRAYKYNDASRLPGSPHGEMITDVADSNCYTTEKKLFTTQAPVPNTISSKKIEKLNKFMVCRKCRGIDVPKEVYQWVHPQNSEIYVAIHRTSQKSDSDSGSIYDVPFYQFQGSTLDISTRGPLALPENSAGPSISSSDSERSQSPRTRRAFSENQTSVGQFESENEEEYVSMNGKKGGFENEKHSNLVARRPNKRLSEPYNLGMNGIKGNPHSKRTEGRLLSANAPVSGSRDDIFSESTDPSRKIQFSKTSMAIGNVTNALASDIIRYTPEPTRERKPQQDEKDYSPKATDDDTLSDSNQRQYSAHRKAEISREMYNSIPEKEKRTSKSSKRYSLVDFITEV